MRMSLPAPTPEPSFEDAQRWWSKMQQPAAFLGVPGYPWNPSVLWNTSLVFAACLRNFVPAWARHGWPPSYAREVEGLASDGLQIEFSFGEHFHFPDRFNSSSGEVRQELLDGRMPVVLSQLTHGGLQWSCTTFSRLGVGEAAERGDEPLFTEVRWTVRNPGKTAARAQIACHCTAPHVELGYKVRLLEKAPFLRNHAWRAPLLVNDVGQARLAAVAESGGELFFHWALPAEELKRAESKLEDAGLETTVLFYRVEVPAGESRSVRMLIPFFSATPEALLGELAKPFDGSLAATRACWARELDGAGRLLTPETVVNDSFDAYLYHAMIATGRKPRSGHWILKTSPNNYELLWGAHASLGAFSMDLRGKHAWSRRIFEAFLDNQGAIPASILRLFGDKQVDSSEGFSAHPGFLGNIEGHMAILWTFYHGWTMWTIGQHARLSGDWDWFKTRIDKLVLACEWIIEQRRRTKLLDANGEKTVSYGLMPASNAFDWGFGHVFWSDAHTWRGLNEVADCLRRIGHPKADRYLAETEEYRQDLITAVTRSRDLAEPVPMSDGTTIPFVPLSVEMRDYRKADWTYVACGPLNLAWAGVIPADHELVNQILKFTAAGRPANAEIKTAKGIPADEPFTEANLTVKGRTHLWWHKLTYEPGWIAQAFVFLERDDLASFFEHFYSLISNGGQHVELRSPIESRDGVVWCQPGDANLLWLMRIMVAREQGNDLILTGTCPRAWLADGKSIEINDMLTHFGTIGFRLKSAVDRGIIHGTFDFKFRDQPTKIRLRLRHPSGLLPAAVVINGKRTNQTGSEWIDLPATCRTLEARYKEPLRYFEWVQGGQESLPADIMNHENTRDAHVQQPATFPAVAALPTENHGVFPLEKQKESFAAVALHCASVAIDSLHKGQKEA